MSEIIAILDTETTGLKSHDRVCEIGIALVDLAMRLPASAVMDALTGDGRDGTV